MVELIKKILIIEDEVPLSRALVKKLSHEGFEVLSESNGKKGLDSALRNQPDLILLDMIMPEMEGMEVLEKLREDEWGKNVPVIVLSNLSGDEIVERALKEGKAQDYLIKIDWKIDDIVKKIKGIVRSSS